MVTRIIFGLVVTVLSLSAWATNIPDTSKVYTVKKGDTLWSISGEFLKDPRQWPKIWADNRQSIKNPHWIYPGDKVALEKINGRYVLRVRKHSNYTIKLSPKMRTVVEDKPIPTISAETAKSFLNKDRIVPEELLDNAPYIVAMDKDRLVGAAGELVYVKGAIHEDKPGTQFFIFRKGDSYVDPDTKEVLGNAAKYIGKVQLVSANSPAKMRILSSKIEVLRGDRILPAEVTSEDVRFDLHTPTQAVKGRIISGEGLAEVGQYQMVVINLGIRNDIKKGDILSVKSLDRVVSDDDASAGQTTVKIPGEPEGSLIVYKVYNKISYAMVLKASGNIHIGDAVTN